MTVTPLCRPFRACSPMLMLPRAALRSALGYRVSPRWGTQHLPSKKPEGIKNVRVRRARVPVVPVLQLSDWSNRTISSVVLCTKKPLHGSGAVFGNINA